MGSWTEANIAAWQKEVGIEPATGEDLRAVGGFITGGLRADQDDRAGAIRHPWRQRPLGR
jgi:hypothetical protein